MGKTVTELTAPKKAERLIRLAPYCRVSSDSEDQQHSFAAQVKYYTEYTSSHPEYALVDIYADEGVTGTRMDKRSDFSRLIRDCRKGKIDRIITKSVSRFARNTTELLTAVRMLKEIGVSIYFEEQGIDTETIDLEMILTFPGMAAQRESETISENMRWSYQKRMESGEFNCCRAAYGYDLIDGQLRINETEAEVVAGFSASICRGTASRPLPTYSTRTASPSGMVTRHGIFTPSAIYWATSGIWATPCCKRATPQTLCHSVKRGITEKKPGIMWRTAIRPSSAGKPFRQHRHCKKAGQRETNLPRTDIRSAVC